MDSSQYPALPVYALFATGLCLFVLILDSWSAVARAKTKTTLNKEDQKGEVAVVEEERDAVARVNRVWRNAFANTLPFLVIGFLYVLTGASARNATIYYGVFAGARLIHAVAYLNGKQPWRSLFYTVGQLATLGLAVQVIRHFV
jgi:uncharacterized MAPEG superfamily protein